MFAANAPPTPTPLLSATTVTNPPLSPTSTGGRSRLRGLSYLRNYTQNLHQRDSPDSPRGSTRPAYTRAQSHPSAAPETSTHNQEQTLPAAQNTSRRTPSPTNTSGWLPTPASGTSSTRPTIRQQSTTSKAPSSTPAPTVTTTAQSTPAIPRPMTRNRADTAAPVLSARQHSGPRMASPESATDNDTSRNHPTLPSIRFIPHFDPRANRPSLSFPAITRTLPGESSIIRVGRYSERENAAPEINPSVPSHAPVGFKSKVVSRRHCEFWCANNQWFIKDCKSSSGTFLNHLRLSPPGIESRAYPVNDGDVVQLGIDFRGGEEMIFRCVKIRIECNRGWQKALNNFNKKTHKQLRNLTQAKPKDSDTASVNSSECAICLMSIAPCQSLFVAPCSHVWHYKCIRPILNGHTWPNFLCPNCRAVADLEADVEEAEEDWEEDSIEEALAASKLEGEASGTGGSSSEEPNGVLPSRTAEPSSSFSNGQVVTPPANGNDLGTSLSPVATLDNEATQIDPAQSATASVPRAIPIRSTPGPAGTTAYELTVGPSVHEGPITPRNDAGPFVLDGGAGATTADDGTVVGRTTGSVGRRSVTNSASVQSLDATAAEAGTSILGRA
ncbi:zinc ion binding [Venturia nashicola]|nr:zinc ion binding [Venturia nashicola]